MKTISGAAPTPFCLLLITITVSFIRSNDISAQCPGLGEITLNVLESPAPVITGDDQFCAGGSVTLSVPAGFNTYNWSNGFNSPSITVTTPGTYAVTVTNSTGCSGTASQLVTLSPAPNPNITAAPYQCDGQFTLDAGAGYSSYNWGNGGSGQTITVSTPGTYHVTVTNAEGCTGTDNINVAIPPPPSVSISGNLSFCNGAGTVLSATPGFPQYAWTGGGNGPNLTVNTAGNYSVTATNAFGCTDVATATVDALPFTPPTISGAGILCPGGTLTLSADGLNYTAYNWSNGLNAPTVTINAAGVYAVTVTAANGCTGTASATVSPGSPVVTAITGNTVICNGNFTTLVATGNFVAYDWSNGSSGPDITVNQTGPYSVTVTNAQGCTGTAGTTVTAGIPPNVTISGPVAVCPGGSISITAQPGGLSYQWSNGSGGQSIDVDQPGIYDVTATNANGCSNTAATTIAAAAAPIPVISGPAEICNGSSGTLSVPGNFAAFNWSNGQNAPNITVSMPGSYDVTVTGFNGCTGTDNFNLTVNPTPAPAITAAPYTCNGQLTLNAGAGFGPYSWSNGGNAQTTSVTVSGDYFVTVTDANGCTGVDNFFANIPAAPVVSIDGDNQVCQGATATLTATPGFAAYVWSNASFDDFIQVNQAGTYEVTATDGSGCTATDAFAVSVLNNPNPVIAGPASICVGGSATFSVADGFAAYNWSNGGAGPGITVSVAGSYGVTVTSANGCTGADDATLIISDSLQPQIVEQPYQCDGQITLDAGAGFATYAWSGGGGGQTIAAGNPGNYSVTVSDGTGCTGTDIITVDIPPAPVADVTGDNQICPGETTVLSATPGFGYLWSNGGNTPVITVSAAGNYEVTVTDASGCTATAAIAVSVLPTPSVGIGGPTTICTGYTATFDAGNFSGYLWSTGETTPTITTGAAGNYSVTVTAANGCTGTDDTGLTVASELTPQITAQPYACNGQIVLDAGAGYATYSWATGENTQTIQADKTDTYSVIVTDATGCTGVTDIAIVVPAVPQVSISGNTLFCQNENTTLQAAAGFAAYLWNTGETTAAIDVDNGGTFTVTATDALGCTDTESISVTAQPVPAAGINGPAAICAGAAAAFSVTGNFAQIQWSNGTNGTDITVDVAGTYSVTVTDDAGCTGTESTQLTVNPNPVGQIAALPYQCDGQITLDAGAGFVAYQWSNAGNSQTTSVDNTGSYTVKVTNAGGCTATATLAVTVPVLPQVGIAGDPDFCQGNSTSLTATPGFSSYLWSNGELSPSIVADDSGNFAVTVTDALGCTATASIQVTAFANPAPAITIQPYQCDGQITLTVSGSGDTYSWSNGQTDPAITVNISGNFSVTATNGAGCTGTAFTEVNVPTQPAVTISGNNFICAGETTALTATPGLTTYAWSNGQNSPVITVGVAGNFSVTATDALGCTATAGREVNVGQADTTLLQVTTCDPQAVGISALLYSNVSGCDSLVVTETTLGAALAASAAVVSDFNGFDVSCAGENDGTATVTPLAGQAPFVFQWSNGATSSTAQNLSEGIYTVTVTDGSGCSGVASVTLAGPLPVTPALLALNPTCQNAGSISVENVTGGFGPYTVRLVQDIGTTNGQEPVEFNALGAGTFAIEITDANGCVAGETVVLLPAAAVQEFFSDTIEIEKGDTVTLSPAISITPVNIDWTTSGGQLSCDNCLSPSLVPVATTTVQLDVQGFGECAAGALYFIVVAGDAKVYIPNTIAPESTDNFGFTVYGDERVVRVRSLQIYDRWGGQMASIRDFTPNDPAQGWDGTYREKTVLPGVYVYWAEVEYADGSTEIFSGDVTVLR